MRTWIRLLIAVGAFMMAVVGCRERFAPPGRATSMVSKIVKTDDQWRAALTPQQFRVARQCGTERAFTGEYWNCKDKGVYLCVCCRLPLFSSDAKFNSGTGWPSFHAPVDEAHVGRAADDSLDMARTAVTCARCGAHLGHVFDDGPGPTKLRFCVNSASLKLEKAAE